MPHDAEPCRTESRKTPARISSYSWARSRTQVTEFDPERSLGNATQELLTAAQTAYMKGDIETAKKNFQAVTKVDPKKLN